MKILSDHMQSALEQVIRSRKPVKAHELNTLTAAALIGRGAIDVKVSQGQVILVATPAGKALAAWSRQAKQLSWADARKVAKRR
jgi:hypothetical protein